MSRSGLGSAIPSLANAMPKMPVLKSIGEYAFESLVEEVKAFEASLSAGEAVGALLASFGTAVTIQISQLSCKDQFICFDGTTPDGNHARLVQHYTQASMLLVKLTAPTVEPAPIGFIHSPSS
ncbi:DUF6173 family protein [Burkholderia gladioli]|uniref:DUF6173 family protein n=1 Tax=Burkholderia gladioli TaxID=28095 RepID=UPI00163E665B|nr:DUF6173 family protein [Burkholderia gladioli]